MTVLINNDNIYTIPTTINIDIINGIQGLTGFLQSDSLYPSLGTHLF